MASRKKVAETKKVAAVKPADVETPSAPEVKTKAAAAAKVQAEAEASRLDETVPGGAYIVGGVLVNAKGEPIDDGEDGEE